jgi:hypothetical protein
MPNAATERGTTTTSDQSALASIHTFLDPLGLGALAQDAYDKTLRGVPWEQVLLDIRASDQYKAAFPGLSDAVANGDIAFGDGMEAQYRSLVGAYQQVNAAYGLPKGFYDTPDQIAQFIKGRVSPEEYKARIAQYTDAVLGDTETLNQLGALYGQTGHTGNPVGDLLAHYADPNVTRPLLTEQLQAASFAAAAKTSGFGQLTAQQAEQFGARQDVTAQQAQQGFGSLVHARELMQGLPGEQADQITQTEQLGAAFGGDVAAQEKLDRRARTRVAQGQGGGQFSSTARGASGLTSSQV